MCSNQEEGQELCQNCDTFEIQQRGLDQTQNECKSYSAEPFKVKTKYDESYEQRTNLSQVKLRYNGSIWWRKPHKINKGLQVKNWELQAALEGPESAFKQD